jgi:hypothetical protein
MIPRRASPFFQPKIRAVAARRADKVFESAIDQGLSAADARDIMAETYAKAIVELNEAHPEVTPANPGPLIVEVMKKDARS